MADSSTAVATELRDALDQRKGPEDGTIVRFVYEFDQAPKKKDRTQYTYAAIWIAKTDRWYVSGQGDSLNKAYTHAAFLDLLAKSNAVSADVAGKFAPFKP